MIEPRTGRERYVPLTPIMLIRQVFKQLTCQATSGLVSIAIQDIYMKQPYFVTNKKGKQVKKQRYVQIAVVVTMRLKEDEEAKDVEPVQTEQDQPVATYRGLFSNQ